MNLQRIFSMQGELDTRIEELHKLNKTDTKLKKMLALVVEVGEFANETRTFKFWSSKGSSEKKVILEEYVDGIHFLVGIGLDVGAQPTVLLQELIKSTPKLLEIDESDEIMSVITRIGNLYNNVRDDSGNRAIELWVSLFVQYINLGKLFGFTLEEMEGAYFMKNEKNHQRQDNGY